MSMGPLTEYRHTNEGGNFSFVCWYWNNSRAWGHEVRLMRGMDEVASARIRYYNRTWERFTFETTMLEAIDNYHQSELQRYIDNYKWSHEIEKFKNGEKQQVVEDFDKEYSYIQELRDYIKSLY